MRKLLILIALGAMGCGAGGGEVKRKIEKAKKDRDIEWMNWYADKLELQAAIHDSCIAGIDNSSSPAEVVKVVTKHFDNLIKCWKENANCPTCEEALNLP